jgi:hypothetical protein
LGWILSETGAALVSQKRTTGQSKPSEYKPTDREAAAITKFLKETAEKAPRVKVSKQGKVSKFELDHPNNATGHVLLMEALGTIDPDFSNGLLRQLLDTSLEAGLVNEVNEERVNFMLAVIKGIKPRDQVEAMLAAQMAAVHVSAMKFARRLARVESIPQQDSAERAFNKLTRTFASQMEALKRYRTGGEQKVTVQHVTVGEGGQAIVGNVTQERREGADKSVAPPLAIEDAKMVAMPTIETPTQEPVPVRNSSKKK